MQTYIAEIAQPQHRGWLGGLTSPILAFGALVSYSLGSIISWHYVAIIGIFIPLIMVPGLFLLPDTPYWYIQKGDEKKALQVILNLNTLEYKINMPAGIHMPGRTFNTRNKRACLKV